MKQKIAKFVSVLSIVLFVGLVNVSILNAAPDCNKQVQVCLDRLDQLTEVLNKVAEQCAETSSDGCQTAVANLDTKVAELGQDCAEKIDLCVQ